MNRFSNRKLIVFLTLIILLAVLILLILMYQPERNSVGKLENGPYDDYIIRCEKTDETVKETQNEGGGVSHTYEWIVYRCTASVPGESTPYELDLELSAAVGIYLHWLSCENQGLLTQGDFVVDDTEYDIVLEDTLMCVSTESD